MQKQDASSLRYRSRAGGRSAPADAPDVVAGIRLTHPDRVLYPAQGTTKRDLALFYASIEDWILPHLAGRPTMLLRCPEGAEKECFFQKHAGRGSPAALRRVRIQEARKVGEYMVVDDLPGLVGLVQIGVLEVHTWGSVADRLEQPDRIVFDLDPDPSVPWGRVVGAAQQIRTRLEALDLASFVKTTGGKGLHVLAPIVPAGWDEVSAFAEALARDLATEEPSAYTAVMSKAERQGKIFVDYLRNHRGATTVAAYSTRARPGAPVSTPLRWDELDAGTRSDHYTIRTLRERLDSLETDPWSGFFQLRQRLPKGRRTA